MKFKNFLNVLFPKGYSCLNCGYEIFDEPYVLCEACKKLLPYIKGRVCLHCGEPLIADGDYCKKCKGKEFVFERAFCDFEYDGIIKKLIYGLKYGGKKYYGDTLGVLMAECVVKNNIRFDKIIPVPLCDKRLKQRGYNQSKIIADCMVAHLKTLNYNYAIDGVCDYDNVIDDTSLIRIKETPTQTNLTTKERKENMKDAFKVVGNIKGKTILLIDDVHTTGATLTECSSVLKDKHTKCVYAITSARTIIKDNYENVD